MKTKVSKNQVIKYFGKDNVVCFGYCRIQELEPYLHQVSASIHYTEGVYGRNADIYCIEGGGKFFAICTGYRPFGVCNESLSKVADKYIQQIGKVAYEERATVVKEFVDELWDTLQELRK